MSQTMFQPAQIIRQQLLTESAEKAESLLDGRRTAQLEEQILIGQEMEALLDTPGWARVEAILAKKLMSAVDAGKADVTAEIASILRLVYLPTQLAKKAQEKLAKNAEKEKKYERSRQRSGSGKRGSIFRRGG